MDEQEANEPAAVEEQGQVEASVGEAGAAVQGEGWLGGGTLGHQPQSGEDPQGWRHKEYTVSLQEPIEIGD